MALCISVRQTNLSHATTLSWYGTGLARSLFALVREASHYIRVCRTPESGLSQVVGNSVADSPIGYPSGRHLGFSRRGTGATLEIGR
jgi:hypothetical protein